MGSREVKMACFGEQTNLNKEPNSQISLQIQDLRTGATFADSCDILLSASGVLNDWKWPSIPGLHKFKGMLLHSAKWDEEYDYSVITSQRINIMNYSDSTIRTKELQ
jgi:hypothetical protein